jgi:hypothetical protein
VKRAAVIFVALLALGCGKGDADTAPPAKGKANLRVTVVAQPKSGAKGFRNYNPTEADKAAAAATGEFELVDYEHLDRIVVWAQSLDPGTSGGATPSKAGDQTIAIKSDAREPVFAAAARGGVVGFQNLLSKPLRLYSVSEGNEFDLGQLPTGATAHRTLDAAGLIELLDGDTLDVVARVYVAPGQPVKVVHAGKATTLRDLEPGRYRVAAWHERVPGAEQEVMLVADSTKELTLLIGVNALPKVE